MLDTIVSLGISVSNAIYKRQCLKSSLRSDLETERDFFFSKAEIHTANLHITKMPHFLLIASIIGDAWCRNSTNFGFIICIHYFNNIQMVDLQKSEVSIPAGKSAH